MNIHSLESISTDIEYQAAMAEIDDMWEHVDKNSPQCLIDKFCKLSRLVDEYERKVFPFDVA